MLLTRSAMGVQWSYYTRARLVWILVHIPQPTGSDADRKLAQMRTVSTGMPPGVKSRPNQRVNHHPLWGGKPEYRHFCPEFASWKNRSAKATNLWIPSATFTPKPAAMDDCSIPCSNYYDITLGLPFLFSAWVQYLETGAASFACEPLDRRELDYCVV